MKNKRQQVQHEDDSHVITMQQILDTIRNYIVKIKYGGQTTSKNSPH